MLRTFECVGAQPEKVTISLLLRLNLRDQALKYDKN